MLTSLRSRLWVTYFLIAVLVTGVTGAALVVYVLRNPASDRREAQRLHVIAQAAGVRSPVLNSDLETAPAKRLEETARRADNALNARIAVFDANGVLLVDSRPDDNSILPPLKELQTPRRPLVPMFRDPDGNQWIYALATLENGGTLLAAAPRQRLPILTMLADEILPYMLRGLLIALALSLLMGLLMARWISAPLAELAKATQTVASGDLHRIEPKGPKELREVTLAFNDMAEKVHTSRRAQRDLTANVSHDLKTPLTSVQGFAQAILDGAADDPASVRQSAQVIYDEAGRMSRMVNHLLDLARLEEGSLPLERAPLDLTALLERVAQQLTPQAQAAQVQLEFAAQDNGSLRLVGDDDRLAQVFTNLVDNAIKFTPPGGQVVVRCERSGDRAVVLVQDSGPGIAKGDLERIFERFYQADKARQGGGRRGAGLGLAICREIVEAHGGDLRAENTPQGGALFTVRLPLAKPDDITLAQRP